MDFISSHRPENKPYLQLLMLIFYALLGMVVFSLLTVVLFWIRYGLKGLMNFQELLSGAENMFILRVSVIAQQLGLFLCPAVLLAVAEQKGMHRFYGFKRPHPAILGLVVVISICAMPAMEWITALNQEMVLPSFLKELENWMKQSEKNAMEATMAFLRMNTFWDYLLNIGMIALLPAIAEEMLFRGALQRTFLRLTGHPHVTIWLCAIIFSAIHMQFYGFLPRMLLGAGFGYLYYWTGSLWYTIFAHFLNNGYQVTVVWYMQMKGIPISMTERTIDTPWYGYLISAMLTLMLFRFLKSAILKIRGQEEKQDEETI